MSECFDKKEDVIISRNRKQTKKIKIFNVRTSTYSELLIITFTTNFKIIQNKFYQII